MIKPLYTFDNYKKEDLKNTYYPPIVDEDPVYSAKFLTLKDRDEAYENLKEVFVSIYSNKETNPILQHDITLNLGNYKWFLAFFIELCKLKKDSNTVVDRYKSNYKKYLKGFGISLQMQYPYSFTDHGYLVYDNFQISNKEIVLANRINYIAKDYDISDFEKDLPAWYSFYDVTIYEKYSEKTNTRIRIDYKNEQLYYFIAGASDNWQQVTSVPIEIDIIVKSIIFR